MYSRQIFFDISVVVIRYESSLNFLNYILLIFERIFGARFGLFERYEFAAPISNEMKMFGRMFGFNLFSNDCLFLPQYPS